MLEELGRPSLEEYRAQSKTPVVVVLDNVRSALNVGAIFRSCDAFAIEHLWLCGITAQPPHRDVLKSAIGATESVPWSYATSTTALALDLRAAGYNIWGVEQTTQSVPLEQADIQAGPTAVIFGNEVGGLADDLIPHLDLGIEIQQFGTKHSLNVAVCAGIVLWHLARFSRP